MGIAQLFLVPKRVFPVGLKGIKSQRVRHGVQAPIARARYCENVDLVHHMILC